MPLETRPFSHSFRVRYAETDKMQRVYYANYFIWMEGARVEYIRSFDMDYKRDFELNDIFLPVKEAFADYKGYA